MANKLPIAHLFNKRIWELSGGQAQLVCIARALISCPRLLILDEPFSALDLIMTNELGIILKKLAKSERLHILLVSHNIDHTIDISDSLYVLGAQPGKILLTIQSDPDSVQRTSNKSSRTQRIIELIAASKNLAIKTKVSYQQYK